MEMEPEVCTMRVRWQKIDARQLQGAAPFRVVAVLRAVGSQEVHEFDVLVCGPPAASLGPLLPFRRQRRYLAVGRIHDERCALRPNVVPACRAPDGLICPDHSGGFLWWGIEIGHRATRGAAAPLGRLLPRCYFC